MQAIAVIRVPYSAGNLDRCNRSRFIRSLRIQLGNFFVGTSRLPVFVAHAPPQRRINNAWHHISHPNTKSGELNTHGVGKTLNGVFCRCVGCHSCRAVDCCGRGGTDTECVFGSFQIRDGSMKTIKHTNQIDIDHVLCFFKG